ncbi:MAG TPA: HAD family hydrolase, partial [Rhodanobacteraceae bacterium]|nr:HAD family hydrolase [Rhodanobacteraceae bacterium]
MSATLQPESPTGDMGARRIVLFDFDGTLVHGDAYTMFIRERYRRGWWRGLLVLPIAPVLLAIAVSERGRRAAARMMVRLALLGTDQDRYRERAENFGRELARNSRLFSRLGISTLRRHMY